MNVASIVCHPDRGSMTWSVYAAFDQQLRDAVPGVELDLIDLHGDEFQPAFTPHDLSAVRFEGPLDDQIL